MSTIAQLIETVHDFAAAMDAQQQIDVICIDFAKAFDKVPRDKLIFKLREIGVDEGLVLWAKEYLRDRK